MALKQIAFQPSPIAAMPEISVAENHDFCRAEDKVRIARQIADMLAVAKPQLRQLPAQQNLMQGIRFPVRTLCP